MHELGIVFHIIETLEEVAKENKVTHIERVTMEIGEVSAVIPDYLADCWRWAADRTELLKDARLEWEILPAVTICNSCGKTYPTVEYGRTCPYCKSGETVLLYGREVNIKEIAVDDYQGG